MHNVLKGNKVKKKDSWEISNESHTITHNAKTNKNKIAILN